MIDSAVTLLPQPDSPTMPSVRPALEREADAIDRRELAVVGSKSVRRPLTSSSARRLHDGAVRGRAWRSRASIAARSVTPPGRVRAGRQAMKGWKRSRLFVVEPLQLDERLGVVVDAQVERRILLGRLDAAAPPPACRACRRRPPRPRRCAASSRSATAGAACASIGLGASPRSPRARRACCRRRSSRRRARWPHQSMQCAPVCAAPRPCAPMRCSWRWSRPSSAAMRRRTDPRRGCPRASRSRPGRPVERVDERLRGERADAAPRRAGTARRRRRSGCDRDAEGAVGVAGDDRPG